MGVQSRLPETGRAWPSLRAAWWSLGLLPVSFVLAFVVGEGMPGWLGYADPSAPPWEVRVLSLACAAVVFASPAAVTAVFSRRAARAGSRSARLPLVIAVTAVSAFVLVNLVSGLLVLLFG